MEVGAVRLADADAAVRPLINVAGCAPMSAKRLTVACCMFRSTGPPLRLLASRPQAHCTVPAPNTQAPLGAR